MLLAEGLICINEHATYRWLSVIVLCNEPIIRRGMSLNVILIFSLVPGEALIWLRSQDYKKVSL